VLIKEKKVVVSTIYHNVFYGAHNPKVIGSNPFPATNKFRHLAHFELGAFFCFHPLSIPRRRFTPPL